MCDVTRNVCVPCTAESQALTCPKDRPVCDETIFQCVTCLPTDGNSGNDTCLAIDPEKPYCLADPDNSLNNTCITCNSTTDAGQCLTDASAPICRIDETTGAGTCSPCTNSEQCRVKENTPDLCDTKTGACVECLEVTDCAAGMLFCEQGQCMNCHSNDDCQSGQCLNGLCYECASDEDCSTPERPVCLLDSNSRLNHLCVECDPTGTSEAQSAQCGGRICNEITGKCDPCTSDDDCTLADRGICVSGSCMPCDDKTDSQNCQMVCSQTTGKCDPCIDVPADGAEINCQMVCDSLRETCEPCDNVSYFCKSGVCHLEDDENKGICEPCSAENCPNGTCGEDGLCHKVCETGTLCTKPGLDSQRESCCTGTQICTSAAVCITPGDDCRRDTDCPIWEICDIPDGAEIGKCVPVHSDPEACFNIPKFEAITPKIKWHYTTPSTPTATGVVSTPIVIDLTHDGIPEVVFTDNNFTVTALNGTSGEPFAVTGEFIYNKHNDISAADIDNDGEIEVLVPSASTKAAETGLYILNLVKDDAGYKWQKKAYIPVPLADLTQSTQYWADLHPTIADIDADGIPEIVTTRGIAKGNDLTKWQCTMKIGQYHAWYHYMFAVADLDQDGLHEIIADKIYDTGCQVISNESTSAGWGYAAVADILPSTDEEGELVPEIVRVKGDSSTSGGVGVWKVYKKDGVLTEKKVWAVTNPGGGGGNPVIADFNGDGLNEIGVAGATKYVVFNGQTGEVIWSAKTDDDSSFRTGSSVFDFEADGKAEVVYRDQQKIRIYNGSDGAELWSDLSTSGTVIDYPLIVDVDGDGQTEIVITSELKGSFPHDRLGITVYADTYGKWVPTRKIWNQHSYHVTNINDDGTVPKREEANWLNKRLNNYRANTQPEGFYNQPNFIPGLLLEDKTLCAASPQTLGLKATVGNLGDKSIEAEIQISFYIQNTDASVSYYLGTTSIPGLAADARTTTTLNWDGKTAYPIDAEGHIGSAVTIDSIAGFKAVFVVDDAANTGKSEYDECKEDDNRLATSLSLNLTGC